MVNQLQLSKVDGQFQQISPVIIAKFIMPYGLLWSDSRIPRSVEWRVGNALSFSSLVLTFFVFLYGLPEYMGNISDFGMWFSMINGGCNAILKVCFSVAFNQEISAFLDRIIALDVVIREKAKTDQEIQILRSRYLNLERFLCYFSLCFTIVMGVVYFVPEFFKPEMHLISPSRVPWGIEENPLMFTLIYVATAWGSTWGGCSTTCLTFLAGNMANQLILNLKILVHEVRLLGRDTMIQNESAIKKAALIRIIHEYQNLRQLVNQFNTTFHLLLLHTILENSIVLTFISVQLAVTMNVDKTGAIRPAMYFIFQTSALFYWCWLGERLAHVSQLVSLAVYEFDWNCGDVRFKKLRLMAMQMSAQSMQLTAKPFYLINYDTFVSVVRRAYTIMAVLKDMK